MKKLELAVLGAALWFGIAAGAAETPATAEKKAPEMNASEKLATVRLIAATLPDRTFKDWMTRGAYNRWQEVHGGLTAPDGSSSILADFFANALLFTGTQNAECGVYAFYNPLQDNLLLIRTDNQEQLPRIEDFVFMTGTEFRGETLKDKEYPLAIVPLKGNFAEVLLGNIRKVAEIFEAKFPVSGKQPATLIEFRKFGNTDDRVAANAALRLALLKRFTLPEAKDDALKAGEVALLLWKGDARELKGAFDFPGGESCGADAYSKLPDRVKQSMIPVVYFKGKQDMMLLGFASHLVPELMILIECSGKGKANFVFLPLTAKFAASFAGDK